MSLSIGIVGLPNVGKSTLFNALTNKSVPAENFPFCTIDPSVGIVGVPDERLLQLSTFSHSKKTIPAVVEFVDIAGLVRGAAEGEGLGNKFLANIREVDVILHVVRFFDDHNIAHVHGEVNPAEDILIVNLELVMADFETVEKRLLSADKNIRRGEKDAVIEKEMLEKLCHALESGTFVREVSFSEKERVLCKQLHLLTAKPTLYVLNKKAEGLNLDETNDGRGEECLEYIEKLQSQYVLVDAGIEGELNDVSQEDRVEFRRQLGALDDGIDALIRRGYDLLHLITFFTTGEDETRGWTIREGSTAPEAGAAIHSDFRDNFIRADVILCDALLKSGSYAKAREKGIVRTVGKDYVVSDGDVIEFKIK